MSGDAFGPNSCRRRLRCRCLLIQSPRVAAICKLPDGMIGYGVALVFGQPFLQTTYAGAPKCVCNRVP